MLDGLIATCGIDNKKYDEGMFFHIFVISKNHRKVFMCEDGSWTEDINKRAETDDFVFAYEQLATAFETEEKRNAIEASLLF